MKIGHIEPVFFILLQRYKYNSAEYQIVINIKNNQNVNNQSISYFFDALTLA
jgi:hypothetical protein